MPEDLAKHSLIGIIEGYALKSIDHVCPFLGAIANTISKIRRNLEAAQLFTGYVALLKFVRRENPSQSLTTSKLYSLELKVVEIKTMGKGVLVFTSSHK